MNRNELLDSLRASEAHLYSPGVQTRLLTQSPEHRAAFVQMRRSIGSLVNQLTTQELDSLNQALVTNDAALHAALADIREALDEVAVAKVALRRVTTAIQIVANVGGIAANLLR